MYDLSKYFHSGYNVYGLVEKLLSFIVSEYIYCILINNENTSTGKCPTLVKTLLLTGQSGLIDSGGFSANQSKPWRRGKLSYRAQIMDNF